MKKNKLFRIKNLFSILCLFLISCNDVDLSNISKDIQINESLVLPIGEATVRASDILDELGTDNDLTFDADTINYNASYYEEYIFPDFDLLKNAVQSDVSLYLIGSTSNANTDIAFAGDTQFFIDLGLDPNSTTERVDSANISVLNFAVTVSTMNILQQNNSAISPSDLKISLVFPKMHYLNNSAAIQKDLVYTQFGQKSTLSINDFISNEKGSTGVPFLIKLKSGANSLKFGTNARVDVNVKINNVTYNLIYGKFNPQIVNSKKLRIPYKLFDDIPAGIRFVNPKVKIKMASNVGTNLILKIQDIVASNSEKSIVTTASFYGSPTTSELIAKSNIPGVYVDSYFETLDRLNGTTDKLLELEERLDTLGYTFSLSENEALNNASTTPSFIVPNMKLKANFNVEIPFYLKAGSYHSLTDSIVDFDLPFEDIKEGQLVLTISNAFPLKLTYSMRFTDASNKLIEGVSTDTKEYVINSAKIDNVGLVTSETVTSIIADLTTEDALKLKNAKNMIFKVYFTGNDEFSSIQVTKDNYLKVKLGAFVKSNIATTLESNN